MLDLLLENDDYTYICHEITINEVSVHDECGASAWLNKMIANRRIIKYTDSDVIRLLTDFYGDSSIEVFKESLKESCDVISFDYYLNNYQSLQTYKRSDDIDLFLSLLNKCDKKVGNNNNLGEIKVMVLLKTMQLFYPNNVYVFCSDDRRARIGMYSITQIACKSLMTVFWEMHKDAYPKEEAQEFFIPIKNYLTKNGTNSGNIRVFNSKRDEQLRIPCQKVFDDIFDDKLDALIDGMLRYIN